MADNAPNAVARPPFPNVVYNINKRVLVHIATFTVASGTATVNQSLSSAGITVTNTATGRYTVTFPPGTTGSIGWTVAAVLRAATPDPAHIFIDSDLDNYATGTLEFELFADDADTTADSLTVNATLLIHQILA